MSLNLKELDAVVVGAGFSGLYLLHLLREKGLSAQAFEAGGDVGGTWYWNRYPGACCDVPSVYYSLTFSQKLYNNWSWSSKLPYQEEILRYLNYVADSLQVRDQINLNTKVTSAAYLEDENRWHVKTNTGIEVKAKYFISAVGSLSAANMPTIHGMDTFKGEIYHTGHWPHTPVDYKNKKVAVIGTGSSGVQVIPIVAQEAEELTVFQRTPGYIFPAKHETYPTGFVEGLKENFNELQKQMNESYFGFPVEAGELKSALQDSSEERKAKYQKAWDTGGWAVLSVYYDTLSNDLSNEYTSEFIRTKIRETVIDSNTAELLCPTFPVGAKRVVLGTDYYETFNRENVNLISVKETPIIEITDKGILTSEKEHVLDMIIFATGFDAMTAPLMKLDIQGRNGLSLKEKWQDGANVRTCLGITNKDFPNMFSIWGPHSPVFANIPKIIEINAEYVIDLIEYCQQNEIDLVDTTEAAEEKWMKHIHEIVEGTIFMKVDSWYNGGNIEGKTKGVITYLGDVQTYRSKFNELVEAGYDGLILKKQKEIVND